MSLMPAIREKRFHTRCQEEVYREVKAHLAELVDEYFDDAEHCDFYLKYGSTVLEISIDPYEEDDAVIEVLAFCVQGVEPSFEMMRDLLRLNSEVPLGAFSLVGKDIFFSHSFLGRRMRPEQFIGSLTWMYLAILNPRLAHRSPWFVVMIETRALGIPCSSAHSSTMARAGRCGVPR